MSLLEAVVLGIIQGLTEFLPISSTAHLRIVPALAGWEDPGAAFTAVTQLGTMAAVLLYFRDDLSRIARAWLRTLRSPERALRALRGPRRNGASLGRRSGGSPDALAPPGSESAGSPDPLAQPGSESAGSPDPLAQPDSASVGSPDPLAQPASEPASPSAAGGSTARSEEVDGRLGWYIVLGTVPIVIFGVAFQRSIETSARNLYIIVGALIVVGLVMSLGERVGTRSRPLASVGPRDGIVLGLAQALALIPGVSRSGATITTGLFLGLDRADAARFSFLLSVPAVVLSGAFELMSILQGTVEGGGGFLTLLVATALAFVSGYGAIAFLLRFLVTHSTNVFVVYRIALGLLVLGLALGGSIR